MRRGYNRKVYLRIPANCIEDIRHAHFVVSRLHESSLHGDDDENDDICRDDEAGRFGDGGDGMPTEEKGEAHLKDSSRVLARSDTDAKRIQRKVREVRFWIHIYSAPGLKSRYNRKEILTWV